jgi:hypothetical protein
MFGKYKIGKGGTIRVNTDAGWVIRNYNSSVEIEDTRNGLGVEVTIVGEDCVDSALAPLGAVYMIRFYKSGTSTGASGRVNEVKTSLPGGIYIGRDGATIRGCKPTKEVNTSRIDFNR